MSESGGFVGNMSIIALLIILVLGIIGLVIYFIPTIVAVKRNHINKVPIILVNIFFGWSLIGWVLSLVWALSNTNSNPVIINNPYLPVNNPYPPVNSNPYQSGNINPYQSGNSNPYQTVNNNPYPNSNLKPASQGSETVSAKLQELLKLRTDGVITEEEFQAKRAEILSRF